jgi:hypothetical protein
MLTTEKLFRGDTEFALMEKVRKAEIPPPSKFNRRVNEELDRIVLKALSRDVNRRYQTTAEFAAELDALLEGYRFDPKELRQFMRQMFRKEYAKEVDDVSLTVQSVPLEDTIEQPAAVPDPAQAGGQAAGGPQPQTGGQSRAPSGSDVAPQQVTPPGEVEIKRSFWSRFRRKRKQ